MNGNDISFNKVALLYGWMGNMAPYPIEYEGKKWQTTEALFQALRFESDEIKELIRGEKSPMAAKMKAKKYASSRVVEPFSAGDVENMKRCVGLKIQQHPRLKMWLLETGDRIIYEDIGKRKKKTDFFWGAKRVDGFWEGENTMGKIWMEWREKLK